MSSLDLMTHLCTIQRTTQTNTDGVVTNAWANHSTDVPCLMQEQAGKLQLTSGGQGLFYDAMLFLPSGTDVRPQAGDDNNDRVVMTLPSRLNGVKYLIKIVVDESGEEDHLVAYLTRVPAA